MAVPTSTTTTRLPFPTLPIVRPTTMRATITTTIIAPPTTTSTVTTSDSPIRTTTTRTTKTSTRASSSNILPINTPSTSESSGEGMSGGTIAGLIVGVIIILVGSVFGGLLLLKQRRKRLMHVGRNQRSYGGYPEPDLSRPPMAAFKREDRPGSSFRNSGYDILPKPINRGSTGEYNDLVPPAALVGGSVQGDSYGSGHGYGEGSRNSFNSQLNHGMHAVTGRRGGGFSDGNRRPQSAELDPQQLERERALDLQQQALSLEMSGEPEPLLPTSPMGLGSLTSPLDSFPPYPHAKPMPMLPASLHNVNRATHSGGQGDSFYHPPPPQYNSRGRPYSSQPIPVAGHKQYRQSYDGPVVSPRPSTQYYPQKQQQHPYQSPFSFQPRPIVPMKTMMPKRSSSSDRSRTPPFAIGGELDGYLRKDGQPPTPTGEKQEFDEIHMQRYGAPTSTATSPAFTAVNSIASEPSTEPLFQGNAGTLVQPQHISTIGEVFPSTVTSAPTSGDKEEYRKSLQDNFNAVVPTTGSERSDVVPPAIETSVILPPLPVATKPKY